MSEQFQIIISGIGGQGQISAGSVIAEAAGNYCEKYATLTSSYGTDTRGTFSKSDIIVSDGPVAFPVVTDPDVIVCMHQIAYNIYISRAKDSKTLIFYDQDMVEPLSSEVKQYPVPFTALARKVGSKRSANMVALGTITKYSCAVTKDSIEKTIKDKFKSGIAEANIAAFREGYEYPVDLT